MVFTIFYGTTLRNLRFHINKINALPIRNRQNCLFLAGKCGTWVKKSDAVIVAVKQANNGRSTPCGVSGAKGRNRGEFGRLKDAPYSVCGESVMEVDRTRKAATRNPEGCPTFRVLPYRVPSVRRVEIPKSDGNYSGTPTSVIPYRALEPDLTVYYLTISIFCMIFLNTYHGKENLLCLERTAWAFVVGTHHRPVNC